MRRAIAATELVLIFPAALFMFALFMRNVQPQPLEPAHTFARIVMLYASRPHIGLWVFLMGLPFAVFVIGCATLLHTWNEDGDLRQAVAAIRAHVATLLVALATATSAFVLAIVALHSLTD